MQTTLIQIIQAMLVPGVMVSAAALLLLGMSNKHSAIVNRIRLLKEEQRRLACAGPGGPPDEARAANLAVQLPALMARLKLVRDSVTAYSIGIGFFILSSLFIGLQFVSASRIIQAGIVGSFLAGMACVFAGVVTSAVEIRRGYDIVRIETEIMLDGE